MRKIEEGETLSALSIISEYVSSFSRDRVLNYMLDIIIFFIADFYFYADLSRLLELTMNAEELQEEYFFLHENTPYKLSVYQIIYYTTHATIKGNRFFLIYSYEV